MFRAAAYKRILCPAKLNLILRVGSKRSDGYHGLESLMIPINWGDELSLKIKPSKSNIIDLVCPGLKIPAEKNLAYRAAEKFVATYLKQPVHIQIHLKKVVPTGAGLGGGSSDAAMVLNLLAKATRTPKGKKLFALAKALGADVPFFLRSKASWCTGIGEICDPLPGLPPLYFVLALSPKTPVPTGWAYQSLAVWKRVNKIKPRLKGLPSSWRQFKSGVPELYNDFEAVVLEKKPILRRVKTALAREGATAAAMSGSGSSFFGIFSSPRLARQAAKNLNKTGIRAVFAEALLDKDLKGF